GATPAPGPGQPRPRPGGEASDNSNTQFALLAMWVAGRHGVPTERTLALVDRRFRTSQEQGGGWIYSYRANPKGNAPESPGMNCAGLLGLAVGHGANAAVQGADAQQPVKDECVIKGLQHLVDVIKEDRANAHGQQGNRTLYCLWSMERVGVMYNLDTINGFDWY